jgi:hypothetical protein
MSAQERTGWRDQAISERHREWGINCPAVDLDFVMIEYDRGLPCAIIEYKHIRARPVSRVHPTIRAMSFLADNSKIPFFIVRYSSPSNFSNWKFDVSPINSFGEDACEKYLKNREGSKGFLIEEEFVSFLYAIRGRGFSIPEEVVNNLLHGKL